MHVYRIGRKINKVNTLIFIEYINRTGRNLCFYTQYFEEQFRQLLPLLPDRRIKSRTELLRAGGDPSTDTAA